VILLVLFGVGRSVFAVYCPPRAGDGHRRNGDVDGDGMNDWEFPAYRVPGDANPPNYVLYCVTNGGRLGLFLIKCGNFWFHRCPYIGGQNDFRVKNGKFCGSSTEGASGTGVPRDADGDGVIERVEYEEVQEDGRCVLIVRTYHDGVLVDTKRVPCPRTPNDLPWPKEPPPAESTPLLPGAWMWAMVVTILLGFVGLLAREYRIRRRSSRREAPAGRRIDVKSKSGFAWRFLVFPLVVSATLVVSASSAEAQGAVSLTCVHAREVKLRDGSTSRAGAVQLRSLDASGNVVWEENTWYGYPFLGPGRYRTAVRSEAGKGTGAFLHVPLGPEERFFVTGFDDQTRNRMGSGVEELQADDPRLSGVQWSDFRVMSYDPPFEIGDIVEQRAIDNCEVPALSPWLYIVVVAALLLVALRVISRPRIARTY
jgi:hypothetical protein